jgi:hypothetical protein
MTAEDLVHTQASAITAIIRGLEPRIHQSSQNPFFEEDGLPGQARQ